MRELYIHQNDADQRVDKFLMKACPSLPKSLMYKFIRNKKIKVNRKRCEISQRLKMGDVIQCFIKDEFFLTKTKNDFLQVPSQISVLYEDDDIIAVDKPIGFLVQKDQAGIQDNLTDRLLHYLYDHGQYDPKKEQSFIPAFAHRLDRNTEGIVLAGKSAAGLRCLNEKLKTHEIEKYYLCIIEGHMMEKQGDLKFYHRKSEAENKAELFDKELPNTKLIHTSYRVLKETHKESLLEVQLHTGKSHQIRASFAFIHHPLYGDVKYGAKPQNTHQALCAYKIRFHFQGENCYLNHLNGKEIILQRTVFDWFYDHLSILKAKKCENEKDGW